MITKSVFIGYTNSLEFGLRTNGQQFVEYNGDEKRYEKYLHGRPRGIVSGRQAEQHKLRLYVQAYNDAVEKRVDVIAVVDRHIDDKDRSDNCLITDIKKIQDNIMFFNMDRKFVRERACV